VSIQDVKHFGDGLAVGTGPPALGAVPGSGAEGAVVAEFAGPVLGCAPVEGGARTFGGEVGEGEVVKGGVD